MSDICVICQECGNGMLVHDDGKNVLIECPTCIMFPMNFIRASFIARWQ